LRWISAFTYASAVALLAAVVSEVLTWTTARSAFLLIWAILLLFVVIGLFIHPMRWPAWGLFVGFWGAVGAVWLLLLQFLATADVLRQPAYGDWAAWPLALLGIWSLVASGLGFGNQTFPRLVDGLGILTGIGLLALSVTVWIGLDNGTRPVAAAAAIAYVLYAVGLGMVFWTSASKGAEAGRAHSF